MSNINKLTTENGYLFFFVKYTAQVLFIIFCLLSTKTFAQEETKPRNFSINAGLNSGLLSGGKGPSFSFHYAIRTQKVLQLESMLFFDSHSGSTFLSGHSQKNIGIGSAVGLRINVLPKKNWNPSLIIMSGVMYSSEITSQPTESKGVSIAISIGISNTFYQKHMVSIGYNDGRNIESLFVKYGFCF